MRSWEIWIRVVWALLIMGSVFAIAEWARIDREQRAMDLLECARQNDATDCLCWIQRQCDEQDP